MFPTAHGVVSQGGKAPPPVPVEVGGPSVYHDRSWSIVTGLTQNVGWRFKVGPKSITVAALTLLHRGAEDHTETVTIYRAADGHVVAQAQVTATDGWGQALIAPVILSPGQDYVVSRYQNGAGRVVPREAGAYTLDPSITLVGNRSGDTADMPTDTPGNNYLSVAFKTTAAQVGHRFYRLAFQANNGAGNIIGTNELGLREAPGGPSVAIGNGKGTSSSEPTGGSITDAAFDGATGSSGWWDTSSNPVAGKWLMLDFGSGNEREIVEYTVGAYPTSTQTAARSANAWNLQASNDLVTWDTLDTVSGESGWTLGETRVFTL